MNICIIVSAFWNCPGTDCGGVGIAACCVCCGMAVPSGAERCVTGAIMVPALDRLVPCPRPRPVGGITASSGEEMGVEEMEVVDQAGLLDHDGELLPVAA